MTDRRALVLRALALREQTPEDIQHAHPSIPLREIRLGFAALSGAGSITQTSWDERLHSRRYRITDEGRKAIAKEGG